MHGVNRCSGLALRRLIALPDRKEQDKLRAALEALEAASRAKEADMAALQDGGSRVGALKQASFVEFLAFSGKCHGFHARKLFTNTRMGLPAFVKGAHPALMSTWWVPLQ